MAVVMSAGPQIVTATFLATSEGAKRNSLNFLGGVAVATILGVTVFYFLGSSIGGKAKEGKDWLVWTIIGLLVVLIILVFVRRKESEPPKWMGKLQHANPRLGRRIGFLLYTLMPTDLIAMVTVGAYIAHRGEPWWHTLGSVVLTILIAGLPLLVVLAMGRRAESTLPKLRDWMNANSWETDDGVGPLAVAVGEGNVWVITSRGALLGIDPRTLQIVHRISMSAELPTLLAVGAGSVWTANHNGYSVSQINPRTNRIVRTVPLGRYDAIPCGIKATRDAVFVAVGESDCG